MHLFKVVMLGMSLTVICRAQTFTVIYSFTSNSTNGFRPEATLALSGTTLFGTTTDFGGRNRTVFKVNTDGTGFAVVLDSTTPDWDRPNGVIVSGNTLYGTTQYGNDSGPAPRGSIFRIDMDGSNYRVLKSFSTNEVGWPKAGLLLIGETLYGTASAGEAQRPGTVFKINTNGSGFMVLYNFTALSAGT